MSIKSRMTFGLLPMVLVGSISASSLEIYQDGTKYRTIPKDRFIGLSRGVRATCDGQALTLLPSAVCPPKQRLCAEANKLEELERSERALQLEGKTLDKMLSVAKPTQIDATGWIEAAAKIGAHQAELVDKIKQLGKAQRSAKQAFDKQAPTQDATIAKKKCTGELELTIPAGYIGAKLLYEADTSDPNTIAIKQFIALTNRSGIDIVAKEADIYARSYQVYLKPQQFSPWVAQILKPVKTKASRANYAKRTARKTESDDGVMFANADIASVGYFAQEAPVVAPEAKMGTVVQTGYKNYHVSGIELPSTGEEIKVKIADYKATAACELVSYPYRDSKVYRACSFIPQSPIEANQWRIQKNKRLVSDQAYGTYRDGKYLLNVEVDEMVLTTRTPIVKRDRSSGIFGGSIRKKDGYTLELTNLSDQNKEIKLIERIPTSTTDKIKSKLLSVSGATSHHLLKDGKLEIVVKLAPHAHQEIKVLFELSYDKATKVSY
jgi:hypothetical protein